MPKKADVFLCIILFLGMSISLSGQEEGFLIERWLVAGPAPLPMPVVAGEGAEFKSSDLLEFDTFDPLFFWAKQGKELKWSPSKTLIWKPVNTSQGKLDWKVSSEQPHVVFLACYVNSSRWQKVNLDVNTHHLLKIFVDGVKATSKTVASKEDSENMRTTSKEIEMSQGLHRLFITVLYDPQGPGEWSLEAKLKPDHSGTLTASLSSERSLSEDDIHNTLAARGLNISPDGKALAYSLSRRNPQTKRSEGWIEIHRLPSGELEREIRDSRGLYGLQWSPCSQWLSAIAPGEKGASDLWLIERKTGKTRILLNDVKRLGMASWSPTGEYIIYTITDEPKEKDPKIERLEGLDDRWTRTTPYKTHLYLVMVESGVCRRLTAGTLSSSALFSSAGRFISPDGRKLVFMRSHPDYKNRPYIRNAMFLLDLETNHAEELFSSEHSFSLSGWSSCGKYLYFIGAQSIGLELPEGTYANDYDTDLFIFDMENKEVQCLTRNFDPVVSSAFWAKDGSLFISVTEGSRSKIYKKPKGIKDFAPLKCGLDAVGEVDIAVDGSRLVYSGNSLLTTDKIYLMDSHSESTKLLRFPDEERWRDVKFGKVDDFSFKNKKGDIIEGWLYYPVGFESGKKYPLIVYYYGGTMPTSRGFNTRLLQYAANGYAVYVLNPSGAIGYGPEFSDLHVNDWGKIVADEIISGIKKLIEAKPFIDASRVGGFGGSYGGFMTETLAYKTDLFHSMISLYGISNITSYWGAGWWGFLYSGVATAGSFPWDRPDIYVQRSPIFHADKIKTPLLLLHGIADINVPVTESEQLFTALKILGKDVEYIRFKNEDHGIRGSDENRILVPKIMLAWWDKYLKDQPEAWEALWNKK